MTYSYGIKNVYRPSALAPNAYGWSTRPPYNRADVPSGLLAGPQTLSEDVLRQQFAYEWFQSGPSDKFGGSGYSNPPFLSGAAGRLHPLLRDSGSGLPARILRGYIRRADYDAGDDMTRSRLYFMYNPESITRDYVSYLNQSALDPFNTIYESGNLVAPPSILDFKFTLFFDRQEEATQADHPGVFVDYQYFDLVVRNVVPTNPNQSGNVLPDNGVMMVSPRDITVVFSPQLTVQGRPLNATVNFERFTHRMVPTRMTISLQMRAVYMGPMRDQIEYKAEELAAEARIPIDEVKESALAPISFLQHEEESLSWWEKAALATLFPAYGGYLAGEGILSAGEATIDALFGTAGDANDQARKAALTWAYNNVTQGGPGEGPWTDYMGATSGASRYNLPHSADCSGLITEAYIKTGNGTAMGWNAHPGTAWIIAMARKNTDKQQFIELSKVKWQWQEGKTSKQQALQPGDILIRDGHVVFFFGYENKKVVVFDASSSNSKPEVGKRNWGGPGGKTWYVLRPTPVGSSSSASSSAVWTGQANGSMTGRIGLS